MHGQSNIKKVISKYLDEKTLTSPKFFLTEVSFHFSDSGEALAARHFVSAERALCRRFIDWSCEMQ
jgi:hypothetical protein